MSVLQKDRKWAYKILISHKNQLPVYFGFLFSAKALNPSLLSLVRKTLS